MADLEGHLAWQVALAVATAALTLGEHDRAVELTLPMAEAAQRSGAVLAEAELLGVAALAGRAADVCARLGELATRIEGELWPLRARHVEVLADRGPGAACGEVAAELDALDKSTPIIFHCHHGMRSRSAAERYAAEGFSKVYNLEGGIDAWSLEVDPKVARY
jgi:monothiol glutaredoxin